MKRFFKLISGEVVFGEVEGAESENGIEILVKEPYTARSGSIMPYMIEMMGNSPQAIQVNPMNIVWSAPLDEFPGAEQAYREATTGIVASRQEEKKIIV